MPSQSAPRLRPELVSLVHHVHLNSSGWWKHAVGTTRTGDVFRRIERGIAARDAHNAMVEALGADIDVDVIDNAINALRSRGDLVSLPDDVLRLSEMARTTLNAELAATNASIARTRSRFQLSITAEGLKCDLGETWDRFVTTWLFPVICAVGARTYEFIGGTFTDWEANRDLSEFLAAFTKQDQPALRRAVEQFLDPNDPDVRAYVFRLLDAYYTVEASGLKAESLDAIASLAGKDTSFTLLLDTNVVVSLIGLHGDTERDAAVALVRLAEQVNSRVRVKVSVAAPTLDETVAALRGERDRLHSIRMTPNIAPAVLKSGAGSTLAGLAAASLKSGAVLTAAKYLDPFIGSLLPFLSQFGISLHNDALAIDIAESDDVVYEIGQQVEYEKKVYGLGAKSTAKIRHDVALWHYVTRKRTPYISGIAQAGFWMVTEDTRVMAYDRARQRGTGGKVPVCIHPLVLTQLLLFWSGRTPALEAALLGGMRLSIFVPEFDGRAEEATKRIVSALTRFENVADLTEATITHLFVDEALHNRMLATEDEVEQANLVKEAVLEDNQRLQAAVDALSKENAQMSVMAAGERARAVAANDEAARLAGRIKETESALSERDVELAQRAQDAEAIIREREDLRTTAEHLRAQLGNSALREATRNARLSFTNRFIVVPITVVAAISIPFWWIEVRRYPSTPWTVIALGYALAIWLAIELAYRRGEAAPDVKSWRFYQPIPRARTWIRWIVAAAVAGVIGTVASDMLKASAGAPAASAQPGTVGSG